jgi:hypothetical protein
MSAPTYVTYVLLISSLALVAVTLLGLRLALDRAGWNQAERASTMRTGSIVVIVWYMSALALAWAGFFEGAADRMPTIQYGLFVPIVIALILLWRSPGARRLVEAVPQSWLVGFQFYRVLGVIFLLLLGEDRLPAVFAVPAGSGDVAVGLLAPVVAYAYARGAGGRNALVGAWNVLGLIDLAVAITTGFLTSPSAFQMLAFDSPNVLISAFPLVLVPAFAVPLAIILHVASLMKLGALHAAVSVDAGRGRNPQRDQTEFSTR